jgi:hypothetical protein
VSLSTQWGLFRHYWVLVKFVLTILATFLLLLHTRPIGILAGLARETTISSADVSRLQIQLVGDAGAALLALLVNVTLSVYKPQGLTPYGWRKQHEPRSDTGTTPRWLKAFGIIVIVLVLLFRFWIHPVSMAH